MVVHAVFPVYVICFRGMQNVKDHLWGLGIRSW